MLSYQDWKNRKLRETIVSSTPNIPVTTNGTDDISSNDFFGNMRYKPGVVRQKMIKKQQKNCEKM